MADMHYTIRDWNGDDPDVRVKVDDLIEDLQETYIRMVHNKDERFATEFLYEEITKWKDAKRRWIEKMCKENP